MRIAIIGAVIEGPDSVQSRFNEVVSHFRDSVKGRMGLPFPDEGIAVISLTVIASLDRINHLTGQLGNITGVTVKTEISGKEVGDGAP